LQVREKTGKLVPTKDGWIACPHCGKGRLLRVGHDTAARNLPVYCRKCGREIIVNIDEPEPLRLSH